jgi:hypothetical protein
MNWWAFDLLLSLTILPLLPALVDLVPSIRASRGDRFVIPENCPVIHDFTVLVPIYGNIRYLENVDYLAAYGGRVTLCTTTIETEEFNVALEVIALRHGFTVDRSECSGTVTPGKRQVAGTFRDQIIQNATRLVTSRYVVCIDADTTTTRPLDELVGALVANNLDLASVRLVPSNTNRLLGKFQAHEYRMAMRMRRVMPYLCSGALQISRASAHREIMERHSLFFQGNDAEMGLLGDALGFRVGFLPFEVMTAVPDRFLPWWRQHLAWSGGEFRLFIVNFKLIRNHPLFILYGSVIVIGLWPLRVQQGRHPGLSILSVFLIYVIAVACVNWKQRDWVLLVYPLYGLFNNMILVPLGVFSYLRMAHAGKNYGVIHSRRKVDSQSRLTKVKHPAEEHQSEHASELEHV